MGASDHREVTAWTQETVAGDSAVQLMDMDRRQSSNQGPSFLPLEQRQTLAL